MTILETLKKLHKKMTGQETTSKTIGEVLDSMQENYSGGSSDDSDGTDEFLIETTIAIPSFEVANTDMPWSDLQAAITADKPIRIVVKNAEYGLIINSTFAQQFSEDSILFIGASVIGHAGTPYLAIGFAESTNNGTQIKFSVEFREYLPEATGDDNGKVVGVNNGLYELVDVIPSYTITDAGKVLTVDNNGELAWILPT